MKKIIIGGILAVAISALSCRASYSQNKPINLINAHDLVIDGQTINGGDVPCIWLRHCSNIRITHCKLMNSSTFGIYITSSSNIQIDHNYIAKVSAGVYVEDAPDGQVRVTNNDMLNMIGQPYHKDFVQFNRVNGANNRICDNNLENIQGESNPEDAINLYKCNGLDDDPIIISGNRIRGGGPSMTGSGITIGDQGGNNQLVENNILVNTGCMGIQIAGGTNMKVLNNTIYSRAFPWSHVGMGYGNYSGKPSNNIIMKGNKINWMSGWPRDQYNGTKTRRFDVSYQRSAVSKPEGWEDNILNAPIDSTILPEKLLKRHER
ncbi:MAG: right-handed parallel beta-helix repeat-containing protein [Bacteroidetes bacterium]|nr:right-handed parallel beta-helix repeat-containing protein [Bacteroidota bacterium]